MRPLRGDEGAEPRPAVEPPRDADPRLGGVEAARQPMGAAGSPPG